MSSIDADLDLALKYAGQLEITAGFDPENQGAIRFSHTPPPKELPEQLYDTICYCIEYYQRGVFLGEFELEEMPDKEEDENDPGENQHACEKIQPEEEQREEKKPSPEEVFADINANLKKYKERFILEVKKSLGINQQVVNSPFTQAMMAFKEKSQG